MEQFKALKINPSPVLARLDYTYLFTIISNHLNYQEWVNSNYINLFAAYENDILDFNFIDRGYDIPIITETAIRTDKIFLSHYE